MPAPPFAIPARHLVVMGVTGCGKTTLAALLGQRLGWPVAEADEFHPAANIAKMRAGVPLTDADRGPWLAAIRGWLDATAATGRAGIVTCSALKRGYRDGLRSATGGVRFVHLTGDPATLAARMQRRAGHFMPASLLPSQLQALEPLGADEDGVTLANDTTPDDLAERVMAAFCLTELPTPQTAHAPS